MQEEWTGAALCKKYRSCSSVGSVDLEELCGCWEALSIVSIDMVVPRLRSHIDVPNCRVTSTGQ